MRKDFKYRSQIITSFAVFALSAHAQAAVPAGTMKIAVYDMQKALQSVEVGKKAKVELEREFNAKKTSLQKEEEEIKKATEEFRKQSMVMSDDARARKQAELQDRIMKFQERTGRSQMEIQQKEKDLYQPIYQDLKAVVAETARKDAYTIVIDRNENIVHYVQDQLDITQEVIKEFERKTKKP